MLYVLHVREPEDPLVSDNSITGTVLFVIFSFTRSNYSVLANDAFAKNSISA
jgi:hypothetical protein